MIKLIFVFGIFCFFSCGDKEKTNQEKIIGTWVGYLEVKPSNPVADTFIFDSKDFHYRNSSSRLSYSNYSLVNDKLVASKNGVLDTIYKFTFQGDQKLILEYWGFTPFSTIFHLTKK